MDPRRRFLALAAVGAALCLSAPLPAVAAGNFVVVVNRANSTTDLSRSELKRVVTGGIKQWDNGAVVQIGIIPSDAGETQYLASLLDMTTRELIARIQEQVFKGELRRPATLRSGADCMAFARVTLGAICVASASDPLPPEAHVVNIH